MLSRRVFSLLREFLRFDNFDATRENRFDAVRFRLRIKLISRLLNIVRI
jgi:hypothetical protein